MKYRTHTDTYFLSKTFFSVKATFLPVPSCLPVAQGITILILQAEKWAYVQASNNWFSLGHNIGFHYKAQILKSAGAQLVFFEWGSWRFKF